MPAINQFQEGLNAIGLRSLIEKYPEQFKEVFCQQKAVTADAVEAVFQKVNFSDKGSNKRKKEETTMTYWCDYLTDIEDGRTETSLVQLLSFATGSDQIPFLGFSIDPSIEFNHEQHFPSANTCSMVIRLPVHESYDRFKECMDFGIQNSPGFGMA